MPAPAFSAVVLAGGRSVRMGREKALLDISGEPLWRRQRDVLATAGATELLLSARAEQSWTRDTEGFTALVNDTRADGGPLLGIAAAFERATQPWLAVLAVDLPKMSPLWFEALRRELAPGRGIVGRRDGYFEPLAAIYPMAIRAQADAAVARGEFSLQRLLTEAVALGLLRVREINSAEAAWFENWNEPAPSPGA